VADAIEDLQIESPKAAALLMLGAIRAASSLAKALEAARPGLAAEERVSVTSALAAVLGGELQALINRIVSLHPEFEAEDAGDLIQRLRLVGGVEAGEEELLA
jgi:hypothetical protein